MAKQRIEYLAVDRLDIERTLVSGGTEINLSSGLGLNVTFQYFTSNGTYTKPSNAKYITLIAFSGGGGGGSGRRGAASSVRTGGGGGAGSNYVMYEVPAAAVPATVPIIVGSGGSGGAAVTTNDTNGNPGSQGGVSQIGSGNYALGILGGNGGSGGNASNASGGVGGNSFIYAQNPALNAPASGGSSYSNGSVDLSSQGNMFTQGGSAGVGISATNTSDIGAAGGTTRYPLNPGGLYGGAAGTAVSRNGGNGSQSYNEGFTYVLTGAGGSGYAGDTAGTIAGGSGGNGGLGCGGAGGGGSTNGANSGAGGVGGGGLVIIVTYS